MGAGHDHAHHAHHLSSGRLLVALAATATFMVVEAVAGVLTGSLALLSDAAHMLSDVGALTVALVAARIATRPPDVRHTMGQHRAEVLGAALNAGGLVVLALWIGWEAISRLGTERHIHAEPMVAVATMGLLLNLAVAAMLWKGTDSLNVRAAFYHVVGDILGSIGAITAGALILWRGWTWADAAVSLLIAAILVVGAVRVLREVSSVLMQAAPEHVDVEQVTAEVAAVHGVCSVHDLHIWTLRPGREVVSIHVVVEPGADPVPTCEKIRELLRRRFPEGHVTVQPEVDPSLCDARPALRAVASSAPQG